MYKNEQPGRNEFRKAVKDKRAVVSPGLNTNQPALDLNSDASKNTKSSGTRRDAAGNVVPGDNQNNKTNSPTAGSAEQTTIDISQVSPGKNGQTSRSTSDMLKAAIAAVGEESASEQDLLINGKYSDDNAFKAPDAESAYNELSAQLAKGPERSGVMTYNRKSEAKAFLATSTTAGTQHNKIFRRFILESVSSPQGEQYNVMRTFAANYLFLYGKQPEIMTINGRVIDTETMNWLSDLEYFYDNELRATVALQKKLQTYLCYKDKVIECFILGLQISETSQEDSIAQFSMSLYKVRDISKKYRVSADISSVVPVYTPGVQNQVSAPNTAAVEDAANVAQQIPQVTEGYMANDTANAPGQVPTSIQEAEALYAAGEARSQFNADKAMSLLKSAAAGVAGMSAVTAVNIAGAATTAAEKAGKYVGSMIVSVASAQATRASQRFQGSMPEKLADHYQVAK